MLKNLNICRTCSDINQQSHEFQENTDFDINISEMLSIVLPQLFIEPDLPMPQQLCTACLEDLKICYKFRKQCLKVHEILRKRMAQQASYKENEPNIVIKPVKENEVECHKGETIDESENEDHLDVVNNDSDMEERIARKTHSRYESEVVVNENIENVINTGWNKKLRGSHEEYVQNPNKTIILPLERNEKKTRRKTIKPNKSKGQTNDLVYKINCTECNKGFRRKYQLKQHERVHLLSNVHICRLCSYRFETYAQLVVHEAEHKYRGSFKCDDCERVFEKKAFLASHRLLQHNEVKEFKCTFCQQTFKTNLCYSKHKAGKHSEEKEVNKTAKEEGTSQCNICGKTFHRVRSLREHMYTHTGEKPFECPKCSKTFSGRSTLRQHMLRHQEKTKECSECPMKFFQSSELKKHMITHSRIKPFECKLCGAQFNRTDSLNNHKRIHEGYKPFKCVECLKSFIRKKSLEIHMITHTGARPYKCKYCDRDYTGHGDLNKHMRVHLGDNIYACEKCPETFKYKADLRDHRSEHFKKEKCKNLEPKTETEKDKSSTRALKLLEGAMFSE